jgi:serine-type anaerobic sulfatase-maturating enzyme
MMKSTIRSPIMIVGAFGEFYVQMFDSTLADWVGEPPRMCVHCETCGVALALEHAGDVYSCDHFVEPRYPLGNITERLMAELVTSPRQQQFGLNKRVSLPAYCQHCEVRSPATASDRRNALRRRERARLNHLCPTACVFRAAASSH